LSDKRSHERFAIELEVVLVHDGQEHACTTRDLGMGGMFATSTARIPFGADLEVRLTIPALKGATTIPATVRWHGPGGMGVQWKSLRARQVWALNRLFGRGQASATR
jgi:hypothetical protein